MARTSTGPGTSYSRAGSAISPRAWEMASFRPATTSLPTRVSFCLSRTTLVLALGIFQRLHKSPGGFLVRRIHVRLFVLGVNRQHVDLAVAEPVVVDNRERQDGTRGRPRSRFPCWLSPLSTAAVSPPARTGWWRILLSALPPLYGTSVYRVKGIRCLRYEWAARITPPLPEPRTHSGCLQAEKWTGLTSSDSASLRLGGFRSWPDRATRVSPVRRATVPGARFGWGTEWLCPLP